MIIAIAIAAFNVSNPTYTQKAKLLKMILHIELSSQTINFANLLATSFPFIDIHLAKFLIVISFLQTPLDFAGLLLAMPFSFLLDYFCVLHWLD